MERALSPTTLERVHFRVSLGQQALELGLLGFELAQALSFRDMHAAEPGAPPEESGVSETAVAALLLDRHAASA